MFVGPGVVTTNDDTMGATAPTARCAAPRCGARAGSAAARCSRPGVEVGEEAFVGRRRGGDARRAPAGGRDGRAGAVVREVADEELIERWRR